MCWTHTNAGQYELGSSRSCSVNGYNSSSQAADGVRRERLSCKIAKSGWERWKKRKMPWGHRGHRGGQGEGVSIRHHQHDVKTVQLVCIYTHVFFKRAVISGGSEGGSISCLLNICMYSVCVPSGFPHTTARSVPVWGWWMRPGSCLDTPI